MVGLLGLEPKMPESKPGVLPITPQPNNASELCDPIDDRKDFSSESLEYIISDSNKHS
jgi:hypothetical protein